MIQEIITYCIVALAVGLAFYRFYKVAESLGRKIKSGEKVVEGGKCSCCSAECSLKNLHTAKNCHPLDGKAYILH